MKKTKVLLPLTLSLLSMNLTSCAKTLDTKNYSISAVKSMYGYKFAQVDVTVTDGVIDKVTIDETYSPCTWARLTETDAASLGEDNFISVENVTLEDGTEGTLNFAKYIQVCGDTWVGNVREEIEKNVYYKACEYIQYSSMTSSDEDATDLLRYLNVSDTDVYQFASRVGKYYTDVMNGDIKILKAKDAEAEKIECEETSIAPYFPNGKKNRSDNEPEWKTSIDALCAYFAGKKLNYNDKIYDKRNNRYDSLKIKDGEWTFSPGLADYAGLAAKTVKAYAEDESNFEKIEGCKSAAIDITSLGGYFKAVNNAFASLEYKSKY